MKSKKDQNGEGDTKQENVQNVESFCRHLIDQFDKSAFTTRPFAASVVRIVFLVFLVFILVILFTFRLFGKLQHVVDGNLPGKWLRAARAVIRSAGTRVIVILGPGILLPGR